MHIVVVGGRERNEVDLARIAAGRGHSLECLDGDVAGRGIEGIRNAVARASIVVIVTEINSHGGVQAAKREAQRFKKPTMVASRFSTARLRGLMDALAVRAELPTLHGSQTELRRPTEAIS
jgi:hypothetical protein